MMNRLSVKISAKALSNPDPTIKMPILSRELVNIWNPPSLELYGDLNDEQ